MVITNKQISCLYLAGGVMILVIVISHKCKINPDNIATPIAASLGDLTTLAVLAGIGGFLFKIIGNNLIDSEI
jgi:solute carrier family 41